MMQCFAFYKLPEQEDYISLESDSQLIVSGNTFDCTREGFLISPFSEGEDTPAVFIPADQLSSCGIPRIQKDAIPEEVPFMDCVPEDYRISFEAFHRAVSQHDFDKIVLSRVRTVTTERTPDIREMFFEACRMYPHLAVMLFHTPVTGTWLISTPEPLLEHENGLFHTVALAGTMRHTGEWSDKNRREQDLVERFVEDTLRPVCDRLCTDGPHTVAAGNLVHLKTDITFTADGHSLSEIAFLLHPTPAVCGIPRSRAGEFIAAHENANRKYYSGFAGPVNVHGTSHLFVSLRCAHIEPEMKQITLYAGGGIMPESECSSEFAETEHKMQTIAKCIVTMRI